jgi:inner membrane protein
MMALTHAALAAAGCTIILGSIDPLTIAGAILGSQLPDLDTSTSSLGQILFPVSRWIEKRYAHRTVTHSFLATLTLVLILVPIGFYGGFLRPMAAISIGHFIACFSDCFTKQGVQLFYPKPVWCVAGANPNRRITTGSPAEYWVLCGAIAIFLFTAQAISGGGISAQFAQSVGLSGNVAAKQFNDKSARNHLWAEVKGSFSTTRTRADGRYFVAGLEGKEFILANEKGFYRTGKQILSQSVKLDSGAKAKTSIQVVILRDDEIDSKLSQIAQSNPNSLILLTGNLRIDSPDSVQVEQKTDRLPTLSLSGSTVRLDHHPLNQAAKDLAEQYATGQLSARIITPNPL